MKNLRYLFLLFFYFMLTACPDIVGPSPDKPGKDDELIDVKGETIKGNYIGEDLDIEFSSELKVSINAADNQSANHGEVIISEYEKFPMMELGENIILDFSKTAYSYFVDVETFIEKGLDPVEDIDCSLFTTDQKIIEEYNGAIYKSVDFNYDKTTGKLSLSFLTNSPYKATKSTDGKYSHLFISHTSIGPAIPSEIHTMKAPYVEQLDNSCWAACAMMLIRSYVNLKPDMKNNYLAFVSKIGHETLDQGWNSNFITFRKYDTRSIKNAIEDRIGGGVSISTSSFRRSKSAAVEIMRLLTENRPVMLNHGDHVIYIIGYRRMVKDGPVSFLIHNPQGMEDDMYKWIDWDSYLKANKFNEALFRGDALIIVYADREMLEKPILQTLTMTAADTYNKIVPVDTDLAFTMQAYEKGRKVFPRYNHKDVWGLSLGKQGYGETDTANDTIYHPAKLNIALKVYNADDKKVSIEMEMEFYGDLFKRYAAQFTIAPNSFFIVKNNDFKSDGKVFDSSLSEFFEQPGNPSDYLTFKARNMESIDDFDIIDYPEVVFKSRPEEEPEEFIAFRKIIKDVYASLTGQPWSDKYVWLEKRKSEPWGYKIFHKDESSFYISASIQDKDLPYFSFYIVDDPQYTGDVVVENHPLPGNWKWIISMKTGSKKISIENDDLYLFTNDGATEELEISSANTIGVTVSNLPKYPVDNIKMNFKESPIKSLFTNGYSKIDILSAQSIDLINVTNIENGNITLHKNFPVNKLFMSATAFSATGKNNLIKTIEVIDADLENAGSITINKIDCGLIHARVNNEKSATNLFLNDFGNDKLHINLTNPFNKPFKTGNVTLNNCTQLTTLSVRSNLAQALNVNAEECDVLNTFDSYNGENLTELNVNIPALKKGSIQGCIKLGGYFSQWPQFLQDLYNNGHYTGIGVDWRYDYRKVCDESGRNCEYPLKSDKGYGFYFDSFEPNEVDVDKYSSVYRYFYSWD